MKRLFYLVLAIIFLQSCEEKSDIQEDKNISSEIVLPKGAFKTSGIMSIMGVDELSISEENNSINYKLISNNSKLNYFEGEQFKLSDYNFTIQDNKFYSSKISNLFLTRENNKLYLVNEKSSNNKLDINDLKQLDLDTFILLMVFSELKDGTLIDNSNNETNQLQTLSKRCGSDKQLSITGWSLTPAGALADLEDGICKAYNDRSLNGCWNIDEKPYRSTHLMFHFATMVYCCDGTNNGTGGCW